MNKKHQVPKVAGASGFTLRRSEVLGTGYKFKVYFGPGQTPDRVADSRGYEAPTDWPKAGSLLRVPQVVWLSVYFAEQDQATVRYDGLSTGILGEYDYVTVFNDPANLNPTPTRTDFHSVWTDGTDIITLSILAVGLIGSMTIAGPPQLPYWDGTAGYDILTPYQPTVTNPNYDSYNRAIAAYAEAKSRVEALRPNRTWVTVIDFTASTTTGGISAGAGDRMNRIATPNPSEEFFGTNFLHVYCGILMPVFDDYTYDVARSQIVATFDRFAGYATKFFGPAGDFAAIGPNPVQESVPVPGDATTIQNDPADIAVLNATAASGVAAFNASHAAINGTARATLQQEAGDLSTHGFSYEGESDLITADAMVALIADHFGFDPKTGKDL